MAPDAEQLRRQEFGNPRRALRPTTRATLYAGLRQTAPDSWCSPDQSKVDFNGQNGLRRKFLQVVVAGEFAEA